MRKKAPAIHREFPRRGTNSGEQQWWPIPLDHPGRQDPEKLQEFLDEQILKAAREKQNPGQLELDLDLEGTDADGVH